jgi:hypothetical protein
MPKWAVACFEAARGRASDVDPAAVARAYDRAGRPEAAEAEFTRIRDRALAPDRALAAYADVWLAALRRDPARREPASTTGPATP